MKHSFRGGLDHVLGSIMSRGREKHVQMHVYTEILHTYGKEKEQKLSLLTFLCVHLVSYEDSTKSDIIPFQHFKSEYLLSTVSCHF